jgi:CarD family transcriptional regulator
MSFVSKQFVYPGYGVSLVASRILKEMSGSEVLFYELRLLNKNVTILVPVENFPSGGIRPLSTIDDLCEMLGVFLLPLSPEWLKSISLISWNRRSKDYQNRIRSNDIRDIAAIYRDLCYVEAFKGLSFGERTILAQVDFLLSEECSFVTGIPIPEMSKKLKGLSLSCFSLENDIFFKRKIASRTFFAV